MTERQEHLLRKIVKSYIETGEPIGSVALSSSQKLSSATIRNEMSELETLGYLHQPHVSAGRIPTEVAYQHYIAHCMDRRELTAKDRALLEESALGENLDFRTRSKNMAKGLANCSVDLAIVAFSDSDVFYTGLSHLFSKKEFHEIDQVRDVSVLLDNLTGAASRVFGEIDREVNIFVGNNNPFGAYYSTLLVRYENKVPGMLALLGPMRMDYNYNVTLLEYCRNKIEQF
ncbi:MAG: hypothetical protein G01um101418_53 [Parcubacteria group bacterium Gr01-1014_18]|nr:MAG: hypothetical protein Greene041636_53 [Parcubacteria group bacterium Greene0416_36]TSC81559.1 MAG: hypothetical protein G01um101418_53 [Parcubacteria group bacterium Gr01-1014_18]TSC99630.1 MAG: hypothetical protein Greene101420_34 [Parcubacteria group bacterium Greene1014_20]TSD07081.1 MAG: hypothetical protein Greene07142_393 [Parcubacteria group bacterium Greene0714_2]